MPRKPGPSRPPSPSPAPQGRHARTASGRLVDLEADAGREGFRRGFGVDSQLIAQRVQTAREVAADAADSSLEGAGKPRLRGRVVTVLGVQWEVWLDGQTDPAAVVRCVVKRTLKDTVGLPVVGDWVELEPPAHGMSRIVGIQPRAHSLRRADVHRVVTDQVMAANVDQLIIVASVDRPAFNPGLVDRYMVAAWREGITPVLCVTKCDLSFDEDTFELIRGFEAVGMKILYSSVVTGFGLPELTEQLEGKVSAMAGLSGVGKTSLARKLLQDESLKVGEVSESTGKGRHVTSAARMLCLPGGKGWIIDLPGQRVFGLAGLGEGDVLKGFPELEDLPPCALPACTHEDEEGCTLQEAFQAGKIHERRMAALLRILQSVRGDLE